MSLKKDDIVKGLLPKEAENITKIRQLGSGFSVLYIVINSSNVASKVLHNAKKFPLKRNFLCHYYQSFNEVSSPFQKNLRESAS